MLGLNPFLWKGKGKRCLLLFLSGALSLSPTLFGDFVFDDGEAVLRNRVISRKGRSPGEFVSQLFSHDFWGTPLTHPQSHKSWRPLTTFSYWLTYQLWGFNPLPFHLENLVLHGVNCVLVYFFLLKCLRFGFAQERLKDVAFTAALLFSVHPVHVEPLGGLVGRADLLGALFFFGGFILLPSRTGWGIAVGSGLLSIAASLFKENALMLGVFRVGMLWAVRDRFQLRKTGLAQYLLELSVLGSFVLLRLWFQGGPPVFQPYDNPPVFASHWFVRVTSIAYVWVLNGLLLLCPIWLCYDWSGGCVKLIESPDDTRFFVLIVCFGLCVLLLRRSLKIRLVLISYIIMGVTFLPSSNLIFKVGFVVAERNLYIPSVGFSVLVSCALLTLDRRKLYAGYCVVWFIFFAKSWHRSLDWMNQGRLFVSDAKICPDNEKIFYNIGTHFADIKDSRSAEIAYKTAIKLRPDYYQAMNNLGNLLRDSNRDEAELWLRKAISLKNDFAAAWMNLGITVAKYNRTEALTCYQTALKFRRVYPDCEYNLGNLYLDSGENELAMKSWRSVTANKPSHAQAWINMMILMEQENDLKGARDIGNAALQAIPNQETVHFLMGNVLGKLQDFETAQYHFSTAISLCRDTGRPVPAKFWSNLGVLYHRWGKKDLAREAYQAALKIDPQAKSVMFNLKLLEK